MSANSPKAVVTEFIRRCDLAARGGQEDPLALVSDDVDTFINGATPLSGRFPGRVIVRDVLLSTAKRRIGKASVEIAETIVDGEKVAALLKIAAETVDGRAYNPSGKTCGAVFTVRDGAISRMWLYPDTTEIETVLYGKAFVPN